MLTNRESSGILVNHRATSESTTRVLTETCAFGTCKNDSRYYESWKRNPNGDPMKVFHFPGAVRQSARRRKRIQACHRGDSFVLTEDSYICSLHFVGGNGPTKEDPAPISAVASKERVSLFNFAFITPFVVCSNILYRA